MLPYTRPEQAPKPALANSIVVSQRQKGNRLLQFIRNVPWEYGDIIPDFVVGETACVLYLSIRYQMLQPTYLQKRIDLVRKLYNTHIVLCHVDVEESSNPLEEVTRVAFANNWTLICAWSFEEVARYLETFKAYEHKSADLIKEKVDTSDQKAQLANVLGGIKRVDKRDFKTLATTFGSFTNIATATMEEIALCHGLGPTKVKRLWHAFNDPIIPFHQALSVAKSASAGALPAAKRSKKKAASGDQTRELLRKAKTAPTLVSGGDPPEASEGKGATQETRVRITGKAAASGAAPLPDCAAAETIYSASRLEF